MKTAKIFEIGEQVMVKASISDIEINNGNIKYKLRDEKSGKTLYWAYTDKDIVPMPKKRSKEKKNGQDM